MASVDFLETGVVLGGFRVGRLIGRGGMGVVYEATQVALDRSVALKVIASHLGNDPDFRERFRREGLAQAALDHPHIVPIYEAGEAAGRLYIAMRLIRGRTLKSLIESGDLAPVQTLLVLAQVAEALDTAHARGLVHRDFKPQNVLVESGDNAFLADFGLTRTANDSELTAVGQHFGTALYTAPELVRGEPASARSDVYALAAVLFECLTGTAPFVRESESAVLFAQLYEPPPRPSDRSPELPSELDGVIARGMAKDPADRHGSAWELVNDAAHATGHAASERTRSVQVGQFAARRATKPHRTRITAAYAFALAAAAAAGALLGYTHPGADAPARAEPVELSHVADVNSVVRALNRIRVRERQRLARSPTSRLGSANATQISRAYAFTEPTLRWEGASRLHRALDRAARAYAQLANAGDRRHYANAATAVAAAEAAVSRELATLP